MPRKWFGILSANLVQSSCKRQSCHKPVCASFHALQCFSGVCGLDRPLHFCLTVLLSEMGKRRQQHNQALAQFMFQANFAPIVFGMGLQAPVSHMKKNKSKKEKNKKEPVTNTAESSAETCVTVEPVAEHDANYVDGELSASEPAASSPQPMSPPATIDPMQEKFAAACGWSWQDASPYSVFNRCMFEIFAIVVNC